MRFLWAADDPGFSVRYCHVRRLYVSCAEEIQDLLPLPQLSASASTMFSHTDQKPGESMDEEPRPHANSWQIASVWISAAALLIAAVRAVLDVWLLFRW